MTEWDKPIIYITRDIERALGIAPSENYRIITNRTPYSETIQKQYPAWVTLIDSSKILDTSELLEHEVTLETLTRTKSDILVFKNNSRIESIAKTHGWNLLNPSAVLAEKVENKITQVEWLGELAETLLPPHKIQVAREIIWNKEPLIIQWAHGHTGDSTTLVNTQVELKAIQEKFPDRLARVSTYVYGPSFTVNVTVTSDSILLGNISYQITGIPPFTDSLFTTIGNDWSATHSLLNEEEIKTIQSISITLGDKLKSVGWKGLFGADFIMDAERNKIYLLEINARQPASTTFESTLQNHYREKGITGQTVFEAHLKSLVGDKSNTPIVEINDGSQIIQRVTKNIKAISKGAVDSITKSGNTFIPYSNTEENSDLLRIQSMRGIIETHGKFNTRGKEIVDALSK